MNIIILGGDERQKYLTKILKEKGFKTKHIINAKNIKEKINKSDYIILPLPATKDKVSIYNALSNEKIYISDLIEFTDNQTILTCKLNLNNRNCIDYSATDYFAIRNAIPTAEGAIALAITNSKKTLYKSNCLVIGYGRIGKILSQILKGLGANVTVSARRESDLTFIEAFNMKSIETNKINSIAETQDFVFNTVEHPIIDSEFLKKIKKEAVIIELASLPGGIKGDINQTNCKFINAQGLPGKYSPITAAEILADTITRLITSQKGEII